MKRTRIRIVTPVVSEGLSRLEDFLPYAGQGTELSQVILERGPGSVESEYDEVLAAPDTVRRIMEAEAEGMDAVVIDCMGDPGLKAGREVSSALVLGPAETTMHLAAMLGHRFSVLTVLDRLVPFVETLARVYGVAEKLASVRSVEIPVLDLEGDRDRVVSALVDEAVKAIEEDGAHVLIFGCTGMCGLADAVRDGLRGRGYDNVPVIDPVPATLKLAQALVDLGLTHSKRTYPAPPAKRIDGYPQPGRVPAKT